MHEAKRKHLIYLGVDIIRLTTSFKPLLVERFRVFAHGCIARTAFRHGLTYQSTMLYLAEAAWRAGTLRWNKKNAQQMLSVCSAVIQWADVQLCTERSRAFAMGFIVPTGHRP